MDGACRHIAATLFEVMEFLDDQHKRSVTSGECLWIRRGTALESHSIPITDLKISSTPNEDPVSLRDQYQPYGPNGTLPDPELIYLKMKEVRQTACMLLSIFPMDTLMSESFPILSNRTPAQKIMAFTDDIGLKKTDSNYDEKFSQLSDCLLYTNDEIKCIDMETEGQHKNPNWHSVRKGIITASNVKLIYSCRDQQKTAMKLLKGSTLNDYSLPAPIRFGRNFEEKARSTYHKTHCYHHRKCLLRVPGIILSDDTPFLGASPDGIMDCKVCGQFLVEVKCFYSKRNFHPRAAMLASNVLLQADDGNISVNKKHAYYFQIQTQMAVTGIKRCVLIGYTHKGIHTEDVKFDSMFWENVLQKLVYFYKHYYLPQMISSL